MYIATCVLNRSSSKWLQWSCSYPKVSATCMARPCGNGGMCVCMAWLQAKPRFALGRGWFANFGEGVVTHNFGRFGSLADRLTYTKSARGGRSDPHYTQPPLPSPPSPVCNVQALAQIYQGRHPGTSALVVLASLDIRANTPSEFPVSYVGGPELSQLWRALYGERRPTR